MTVWTPASAVSTAYTGASAINTTYTPSNQAVGQWQPAPVQDTLTWDVASVSGVSLSGLTVSNASSGVGIVQGVQGEVLAAQTSGKYYYEMTYNAIAATGGVSIAVAPVSSAYSDVANEFQNSTPTGIVVSPNGAISAYGVDTGNNISPVISSQFAGISAGDTIGVAVDLDNRLVWFKIVAGVNAGNFATYLDWNGHGGSSAANPGTATGGIALQGSSLVSFVPYVIFSDNVDIAEDSITANFGSTSGSLFLCLSTNPDYFLETLALYQTWPAP